MNPRAREHTKSTQKSLFLRGVRDRKIVFFVSFNDDFGDLYEQHVIPIFDHPSPIRSRRKAFDHPNIVAVRVPTGSTFVADGRPKSSSMIFKVGVGFFGWSMFATLFGAGPNLSWRALAGSGRLQVVGPTAKLSPMVDRAAAQNRTCQARRRPQTRTHCLAKGPRPACTWSQKASGRLDSKVAPDPFQGNFWPAEDLKRAPVGSPKTFRGATPDPQKARGRP